MILGGDPAFRCPVVTVGALRSVAAAAPEQRNDQSKGSDPRPPVLKDSGAFFHYEPPFGATQPILTKGPPPDAS